MLLSWTIIYLVLARLFKILSRTVQIHSIIHCITSFFWTSYILFFYLSNKVLSTDFFVLLQNLNIEQKEIIRLCAFHSAGYFIADTIDIIIDHTNIKRRIYILHHVAAILGLSTIYWGSYASIYAVWCLEIGGMVHHLKHAIETCYKNQIITESGKIVYGGTQMLYHIVYLSSRVLLGLNVINTFINHKLNPVDMAGMAIACVLLVQNFIWWYQNFIRSFN